MKEVKAKLMLHPSSSLIDDKGLKSCYHIKDEKIPSENFQISFDFKLSPTTPVGAVIFDNCIMTKCPAFDSIIPYVPTITCLGIQSSGIAEINGEDFYGFSCLRELLMPYNKIEYLPQNLFKHMPNLLEVSFAHNKIKFIDPWIFDKAHQVKVFNLLGNATIDLKYTKEGKKSFEEFRHEIFSHCHPIAKELEELLITIESQKKIIKEQSGELAKLREKCNNEDQEALKTINDMRHLLNNLEANLKEKEVDDKTFTVIVMDHEFVVNKFVLAGASEPLRKIFSKHPDINSLELRNMSVETFAKIKQFLQTGSFTSRDMSMLELVDLFGATLKLEMEELLKQVKIQIMKHLESASYRELEAAILRCESIVCSAKKSEAIETLIKQVEEKLKV